MQLHQPSVIQAGGIAAGVAILLGILTTMPLLPSFWLLLLGGIGGLLVPFASGLGYGYLAPGEESISEGLVGGFLTGMVSGLISGTFYGLGTLFLSSDLSMVAKVTVGSAIGSAILGGLMGALGGLVWPKIQTRFEGRR
jgi:hypothetical protein